MTDSHPDEDSNGWPVELKRLLPDDILENNRFIKALKCSTRVHNYVSVMQNISTGTKYVIKTSPLKYSSNMVDVYTRLPRTCPSIVYPQISFLHNRICVNVYHYYEMGDLLEHVIDMEPQEEDVVRPIIKTVLESLEFLHNNSIVHMDIKPENIILKGSIDSVLLTDFELSLMTSKPENVYKTHGSDRYRGTQGYVSPEMTRYKEYSGKSDIWNVGVVIFVLLTKKFPYHANKQHDIGFKILDDKRLNLSAEVKDLIRWMLAFEPTRRPTARQALDHPWFVYEGEEMV